MNNKTSYSVQMPNILEKSGRLKKAKRILTILKKEIGPLSKLNCLDVGCSNGLISQILAKNFKDVTAIDIDREAINDASKRFDLPNLHFILMDSTKLSFKADSFDVIVCNQVYGFVNDQKNLVKEIYRIMKTNGVCYMGARNRL